MKTGPFGTVLKAHEYTESGVPVISVGEIGDGELRIHAKTPRVDSNVVDRLPEYVLRKGDVVFARKGAVDRSAWVSADQDGYFLGSDGIRTRFGSGVSARFLAFQLRGGVARDWLRQHAAGTTMPSLNQRILERLPLMLPDHQNQCKIAEVLGALDDRIAANAQLILTSDRLAAARYEALVEEEADAGPLSSIASFVNGKAFTKDASGTGRVVIRIAELNSGLGGSTVYNDIEVADQHLARPGDLLFAWSGSLTVRRWYRPEAIVNQHIFKVVPTRVPLWVVKGALDRKLAEFRSIAADKATTMGHIKREHLDEEVLIPHASRISAWDGVLTSLWQRALLAEQESLKLAEMRDALLPELMSGELRVRDAERTVGEAV